MSVASVTSAKSLQTNYMNLLVTQLRHQDPMDPMDNSAMTAQLAQLSQLDQLETMNSTFAKVLAAQQITQATALIGKQVTFVPENATEAVTGVVAGVKVDSGTAKVTIGQFSVDPADILSIQG